MIKLKAAGVALALALTGGLVAAAAPVQAAPKPTPGVVMAPPTPANNPTPASRANSGVKRAPLGKTADGKVVKGRPGATPKAGASPNKVLTTCPGVQACFLYAEENQLVSGSPATAVSANFSIDRPFMADVANNNIQQSDYHDLREIALTKPGTGADNTLEIGVTVDPTVNGDRDPHLFTFSWIDGVGQGYNGGNGWLNSSNCAADGVCPGANVAADIGTSKDMGWQYFDGINPPGVTPGWWAHYKLKWMGVYVDGGANCAGCSGGAQWTVPFKTVNGIQLFGEIAAQTMESCSDMGNGDLATASTGATVSGYTQNSPGIAPSLAQAHVTNAPTWNLNGSGTSFRYGGPGFNSIGEAVGVKDHCAPNTAGTPTAAKFQLYQEACPDLSVTTGCNNGQVFGSGLVIGACTPITGAGTVETNAVKNNAGVSGRTYTIFHTTNCTGTSRTYGNGAQEAFTLASGWSRTAIKAVKRNS